MASWRAVCDFSMLRMESEQGSKGQRRSKSVVADIKSRRQTNGLILEHRSVGYAAELLWNWIGDLEALSCRNFWR